MRSSQRVTASPSNRHRVVNSSRHLRSDRADHAQRLRSLLPQAPLSPRQLRPFQAGDAPFYQAANVAVAEAGPDGRFTETMPWLPKREQRAARRQRQGSIR